MGGAIETQDIRGRARNTIRTVLLLVRPLIIAAYFLSSSSNGIYKLFLNYTQKEITQLKCLFSRTVNDEKGNRFKGKKNNNRLLNVVICQLMHAFETTSKLLNMRMWEWREFFFFCFRFCIFPYFYFPQNGYIGYMRGFIDFCVASFNYWSGLV